MVDTARRQSEPLAPQAAAPVAPPKKHRLSVHLVTADDTLWSEFGPHVDTHVVLTQVDSIDELLSGSAPGECAVILWDGRNHADSAGALSRLHQHSTCFAVIVLHDGDNFDAWTRAIALRQIVAHLSVPIAADAFKTALGNAQEEVHARTALLGPTAAAPAPASSAGRPAHASADSARKSPRWLPAAIIAVVLAAFMVAYLFFRHDDARSGVVAHGDAARGDAAVTPAPANIAAAGPAPVGSAVAQPSENADLLIEKAQQAMVDRHYIDPADSSALTLYKRALALEPQNGEAQQGLKRLAEILFARAQSALDERKIDVAMQALETARSIDSSDPRLPKLDERVASMRAELGPAQILAAINAQNFDRAAQLIEDAARGKTVGNAKLAQLRDELRRRREEADLANFLKLIDARLQEDKVVEPRTDSAAYYLTQARAVRADAAALQAPAREIFKRLTQAAHAAIEQRRFSEADRVIADLRALGAAPAGIGILQHDLGAARSQQTAVAPAQPQYLDLAQARLAQGKLTEPDNDSALFYVNQLRAADPKNAALSRISTAVQSQIIDQARAALDSGQPARADVLLGLASNLGPAAELPALNQRLAQLKQGAGAMPEVAEPSLTRVKGVQIDYPPEALRKNIEGWVEVSYVVTAEGKTATVKVLNASPAGVFEAAAIRAVSVARYKPILQNGKPIAVSTRLRVAFRMAA